jgi:hypothetical protein
MIGLFAGPFEGTYDCIREEIFQYKRTFDPIMGTNFKYPITTMIYPHVGELATPFTYFSSNAPSFILLFWRWTPSGRARGIGATQDKNDNNSGVGQLHNFVEALKNDDGTYGVVPERVGFVVGGEWDAYAILSATHPLDDHSRSVIFKRFCEDLVMKIEHHPMQSVAAYLCDRAADTLTDPPKA